ncbi:MAG TPA: tetratricopeptide repeat protein, partial [Polyangiaceae bacterium]|nr:tetratricopeptide repeat protein [Polyangiaceae bacterium]
MNARAPRRRWLAPAALIALAAPARAQGPSDVDRRLAQSLFDHARVLLEAGRVAEACPKFEESHRLEPASGTLLNLALCHEQEGKMASAWSEYNESLSLALKESRPDREQLVRERLAALGPKLLLVSVVPAPGADVEGLEVRFDGTTLRRAAWGTPTAVDPGPHRVEASAPGRVAWSSRGTIEGAGGVRTIEVPVLAPLAPAATARPAAPASPAGRDAGAAERRRWAYGLGAAAGAALLVSTMTGLKALERQGEAQDACWPERGFCTVDGLEARDASRAYAWASTISLGAGLAAAVAAPLVLWSAPSPPARSVPPVRRRAPRVG